MASPPPTHDPRADFGRVEQWPQTPTASDWRSADWPAVTAELVRASRDEAALRGAVLSQLYAQGAPADFRRKTLKSAVDAYRARFDTEVAQALDEVVRTVRAAGPAGASRTALDGPAQRFGRAAVSAALRKAARDGAVVARGERLFTPEGAALAKSYGQLGGTRRAVPPGTIHEWVSSSGGRIRAMKLPNGDWKILHRTGAGHHPDAKPGSKLSVERMRAAMANHEHAGPVAKPAPTENDSPGRRGAKDEFDDTRQRKQTRIAGAKRQPLRYVPLQEAEKPVESEKPVEKSESRPERASAYADPDGRKYPVDTEAHVRAAISYFSMPRNYSIYPPAQRNAVWSRIKRAASRFGIEVSSESGPSGAQKRVEKAMSEKTAKSMDEEIDMMKAEMSAFKEMMISQDDKPFEAQMSEGGDAFGTKPQPMQPAAPEGGSPQGIDISKSMGLASIPRSEAYVRIMNAGGAPHEFYSRESAHQHPWACACGQRNLSMVSVCSGCGRDYSGTDTAGTPGGGVSIQIVDSAARALSVRPADVQRRGMVKLLG